MKINLKKFKIVKSTNDTALKLIKKNISNLADFKNTNPSELTACLLDRPRHKQIIDELRLTVEQLEQTLKTANKLLSRVKSQAKKIKL